LIIVDFDDITDMDVSPEDFSFNFMSKAGFDDGGGLVIDEFIVFMSFLEKKLI